MTTASSEVLMAPKKVKTATKPVAKKKIAKKKLADPLTDLAFQCENLTREKAEALVPKLLEDINRTYFHLGGTLSVVYSSDWWKESGADTFKDYVETTFNLSYRKARYLIRLYDDLVESGCSWESFKNLGWGKVKDLASVVTPETVDEWVEKAEALTGVQLQETVAEFKKAQGGDGKEDGKAVKDSVTSTMSMKLHPDQKTTVRQAIDHAKKAYGTEYDAVALEAICMSYLSGEKVTAKPTKVSLKDVIQKAGALKTLETFDKVYPNWVIEVMPPESVDDGKE